MDAVLLAGLTRVRPRDRVIDLGTGCGVVLLLMAHRGQGTRLTGVELQADLAALARENVRVNGFEEMIRIVEADYRDLAECFPAASVDLVVSNPPYRRVRSGRINPDGEKAVARHELMGSLGDVFAAASHLLPVKGRLDIVYPATRLDHLIVEAQRRGFSPKELTVIFSNPAESGRLVHLQCLKGGGEELRINPPFFIYREQGVYTEAMQALYEL
jgi:tRNA1Val (adenine37-N6)-methyltransferase